MSNIFYSNPNYISPKLEYVELAVEQGFADSVYVNEALNVQEYDDWA